MEKTVTIDCSPESLAYYRDGYAIVAVDVIRATTAVAALNRRCFPELLSRRRFPSLEGLTITLFVGTLGGSMPNGFDLTNSPAELGLRSDVYHPMMLLLPSDTKVLCEAKGSDAVYAACLHNYGAQVCFLAASPLMFRAYTAGYSFISSENGKPVVRRGRKVHGPPSREVAGPLRRLRLHTTRREFLRLGGATLAGTALTSLGLQRRAEAVLSRKISLGIYAGNDQWGDTSRVDAYTSLVGVKPRIVNVFQAFRWEDSYVGFSVPGLNRLASKYPLVMLSWEPHSGGSTTDSNPVTLDAILAGKHDAYIRARARDIVTFGKRILLRFGHEMNGNWYSYGSQWGGAKADKYARMWRQVHGLFKEEGANRYAEWVWCPNVKKPVFDSLPFREYYPGDAYVDWTGLDGYNWAASRNMRWHSFRQIFEQSLDELYSVPAATKKVIIAETGCHNKGGDKVQWFKGMRAYLKNHEALVKGLCYFNNNQEGANWRVNNPSAALPPYKRMAADPQLKAALPAP